jgi:hypothetical protein
LREGKCRGRPLPPRVATERFFSFYFVFFN